MIYIPMTVAVDAVSLPMTVAASRVELPFSLGMAVNVNTNPDFEGEYEYTPTAEAQTIPILGHIATQNIVINPIPSNYGLITYNGSVLTVS